MKRFTLIVALVLMVAIPMMAERVTLETARKVATTFLNNNGVKAVQLTDLTKSAGFPNLYVFTTEEGFVVMSADDCVQPILGYSLTGKFVTEGMPENLRWWLQGYSDQIQDVIESDAKASSLVSRQWKELANGISTSSKTRAEIGPLILTKWNQNYPYNLYAPASNGGPGKHCFAGCVATAMAQVMKYHNAPVQGIGSHSYTHDTYGLQTANFGETYYDWNNMPEQINSNSDLEQRQAVAKLIYHCGVAVDMDYGSGSSGAYSVDIAPALINYFNYSTSTHYVFRSDYANEEWIDLMRSELDASRPIIYGGQNHPTNPTGGHSFVCDGYGKDNYSNDYFHFNWGWSGNYNSYFSINDMKPDTNHNYTHSQDAVIEIKPSNCAVLAPTLLPCSVEGRDVTLKWNVVENAVSYSVYRNSTLIGTTNSNSYIDETAPYGTNVYYVRSRDVANELSMPSNNDSVILSFPAPTGLTAQVSENGIQLSWAAAEGVERYNIYCNDILIGLEQTETSFVDERIIAGTLSYFVKSVDAFGDESPASNRVSVDLEYKAPIVNDLNLNTTEGITSLEWTSPECYPNQPSATLYYGSGDGNYSLAWKSVYYAQHYPSTNMEQYAGKKVYKVNIKVQYGGTYTVYIYTDTQNDQPNPESLAATNTIVVEDDNTGWREIVLSNPVTLLENTDLWIVIKQENTGKVYPTPSFNLGTYNANACYMGMDSPTNLSPVDSQYKISWFIKACLTDGTYTYNLYDGTTTVASNISNTSYTVNNITNNVAHQYTLKTNYNGNETDASNMVGFSLGNASINNLSLAANDQMTITEGSSLTVSGTLSDVNAANLIIEDGGQLITNNSVAATVQKLVKSFDDDMEGGWKFIASPVQSISINDVSNLISEKARLYKYDEPTYFWRYYSGTGAPFTTLTNQVGYLYGNENDVTLSFAGTITPSSSEVSIENLSYTAEDNPLAGWNLVGNPFACNATLNMDCYTISGNAINTTAHTAGSYTVAPCTGVMVKATAGNQTVTFTKATQGQASQLNQLEMTVAQQVMSRGTTTSMAHDNAIVNFNADSQLEKFPFNADAAKLYIPQNGKDYAIVSREAQGEMPVNFKAKENGTYTLSINPEGVEMNYLHLIDNKTGNDVDLLQTPSYSFEAKTTDYESRFKLVFVANNEDGVSTGSTTFAFYSNGSFVINNEGNAELQVIDVTGRIVKSESINGCANVNVNAAPGVYMLRLINGNNLQTQKIIIE